MANDINVKPSPIQRNNRDIAIELTKMYLKDFGIQSLEDMQEVYAKFYAVSTLMERKSYAELEELVSENLKQYKMTDDLENNW